MKHRQVIISIVITAVLTTLLLSQVRIADILVVLRQISSVYVIAALALYLVSYVFRALRFRLLLNQKINIKELFSIVCVHNMANNILPARTGELSYIYLVNKMKKVPVGEGIATLAIARFCDVIIVSCLFLSLVLVVKDLPAMISNAFSAAAILLALIIILLVLLASRGQKLVNTTEWIAIKLRLKNSRLAGFLLRKASETADAFTIVKSKKVIFLSLLLSALVWTFAYLSGYVIVSQMGMNISFWQALIGLTFTLVVTILPIWGVAGFGTMEGTWTLAFMLLGVPKEVAISTGFSYHILILVYSIVIGLFGLFMIRAMRAKP